MKKIKKISIEEFWTQYSKNALKLEYDKALPQKLGYSVFFNGYFGNLTNHKFISTDRNEIKIICKNCKYTLNPINSICEAHIGILKGQFEKIHGTAVNIEKLIMNNDCVLESK
ncbi:hypothetical protein ACE01N_19585 [Saccharicrinis sp. FJH2]|uniref:hypothetical protein n=1 Tax=Saccharicrinis sp. FJH65 TaxID=3344659 RepID=UPI0035F4E714